MAQVTQGAAAVGLILVVRHQTGSLALAGGVVAASSIAVGVSRPLQGRLIDRRGSREVVALCGVVHALALVGIVRLVELGSWGGFTVALGALAGLCLPPVSAAMRVEWGRLLADDDRTAAYSLVYLTQELAILAGPLILAAMIALASAPVALTVVAGLAGVGSVGFAISLPRPMASLRTPRTPTVAVLRVAGLRRLLVLAGLVGGAIGALEVAAPTLATAHGEPAAAGVLIASLSVGGIVGASMYAARQWRQTPARRLLVLLTLLTVALGATVYAGSLLVVAVLLFLAGVWINPALTTFSLLVDQHVPARAAGEAFGWLSSAIAGGTGAASALAAVATQHEHDPRAAFGLAAAAGAAAIIAALLSRRTLESSSAAP
ncbi:MAG TPA: MFS transporter [Solirubrobacteraceae bacterium]|nr:MFS transporter [Solirubrobacteraceae bacterium]